MSTLNERVRKAIFGKYKSISEAARALSAIADKTITPQSLSYLTNGDRRKGFAPAQSSSLLPLISKGTGVSLPWLMTGEGPGPEESPAKDQYKKHKTAIKHEIPKITETTVAYAEFSGALAGMNPAALSNRRVPVLKWTDSANHEDSSIIPLRQTDASRQGGPRCFAIEVSDPVLAGETLPAGTVVIIDPDFRMTHGAVYLIQPKGSGQPVLYRYVDVGGEPELHPQSKQLKTRLFSEDDRVIGVVREHRVGYPAD